MNECINAQDLQGIEDLVALMARVGLLIEQKKRNIESMQATLFLRTLEHDRKISFLSRLSVGEVSEYQHILGLLRQYLMSEPNSVESDEACQAMANSYDRIMADKTSFPNLTQNRITGSGLMKSLGALLFSIIAASLFPVMPLFMLGTPLGLGLVGAFAAITLTIWAITANPYQCSPPSLLKSMGFFAVRKNIASNADLQEAPASQEPLRRAS